MSVMPSFEDATNVDVSVMPFYAKLKSVKFCDVIQKVELAVDFSKQEHKQTIATFLALSVSSSE